MTRVALDANVLASGFTRVLVDTSTTGEILRRWYRRSFDLVLSEHILDEVSRTWQKRYFAARLSAEEREANLRLLRRHAEIVAITVQVAGVATHPEDDIVLATAVSAQVEYLVTGDRKLQDLGSYAGVTILSPRAFVELLTREERQ